jgi:hypothetical protein
VRSRSLARAAIAGKKQARAPREIRHHVALEEANGVSIVLPRAAHEHEGELARHDAERGTRSLAEPGAIEGRKFPIKSLRNDSKLRARAVQANQPVNIRRRAGHHHVSGVHRAALERSHSTEPQLARERRAGQSVTEVVVLHIVRHVHDPRAGA